MQVPLPQKGRFRGDLGIVFIRYGQRRRIGVYETADGGTKY